MHVQWGQIERCLRQACMPLLDMIRSWLFEGRLASSPGDFFITASPHSKGARSHNGALLQPVCRLSNQFKHIQIVSHIWSCTMQCTAQRKPSPIYM